MLTFDPPNLFDELRDAFKQVEELANYEWYSIDEPGFDPTKEDDETVTAETKIPICLQGASDWTDVSIGHLLDCVRRLRAVSHFDREVFHCSDRTIFCVQPINDRALSYVFGGNHEKVEIDHELQIRDHAVCIKLLDWSPEFAFALAQEGLNDDSYSINDTQERFISVEHIAPLSLSEAKTAARWFLFELSASHFLDFSFASFPACLEEGWEDISFETEQSTKAACPRLRLRPSNLTRGLSDAYELYLLGTATHEVEHGFACFVKVLEFISATVVRLEGHQRLRAMLLTSKALAPDAEFLDHLMNLIEEVTQCRRSDKDALQLTIQTCCTASYLSPLAPAFLKTLKAYSSCKDEPKEKTALAELSACLSATRNQLAHAKANYVPTRLECPRNQLKDLAQCTRAAAEQAIRWYASLDELIRVAPVEPS